MILDYYNIICPDCNKRLINICEGSDYFQVYCSCKRQENNSTIFYICKKNIGIYKGNKIIFSIHSNIHSNDVEFKDSHFTLHITLISAFGNLSIDEQRVMRDYYINKPYLSEVYNEFMKIIHTYENNLIFL